MLSRNLMLLGRAKFFGQALQNVLQETTRPLIMRKCYVTSTSITTTPKNIRFVHPIRHLTTPGESSKLFEEVEQAAYKLFYVKLEDKDKAELSALYMQLSKGKCTEKEPKTYWPKLLELELGFWRDWKKLGDMPREEAAKKYMEIARKYL